MTELPRGGALLPVDKPAGITSHDVVAIARRALNARRAGHTGTLDPFATGLLILLIGRATRLAPYVEGEPKVYDATIRFGAEMDTDDATGTAIRTAPLPEPARVREAIARLTGEIEQLPPAFSAKQVGCRRAHAAARAGQPLALRPVPVRVHSWEIRDTRSDELAVTITCAGGTYVRALARDLGRLTESAAHLTMLRRIRSGPFDVAGAATLDAVREGRATLLPVLAAVPSLPRQVLDAAGVGVVATGRAVPATVAGERGALIDDESALIAIADRRDDVWQPVVVLRDPAARPDMPHAVSP